MNFLKQLDHSKLLKFALGISIFSVGYLITMFYFQMRDLKEYKQRIVIFNNVSTAVLHLEAEFERETYLVQNTVLNKSRLENETRTTDSHIKSFSQNIAFLDATDNALIKRNSAILDLIKDAKDIKIELFRDYKKSSAQKFIITADQLSKSLKEYSSYIEAKVDEYNTHYDQLIDRSKTSGFLIALISLVIFVLAFLRMAQDLENLKRRNREISFMNQILNNAEMVAGFGSWKFNLIENTFVLSDNFNRLLGLQPKEFEPTLDMIMDFIHPNDREEVMTLHKKSLDSKEPSSITYRYLLKDGTVKHMVSVGKFLQNARGQTVKVGVNHDITELMKKTKELEDKNSKLIAINSELESFNNIVGHDLQEPLRKIQMFISRIENKEFLETASEISITYFDKIKSAANRMQNLMNDLLNYATTIKGDKIFEQVDLNIVLEEILEELSLTIEEKFAKITVDDLPTILGTRFQIQQLFVNLISNALKYVKPGIPPVISVKLEDFTKEMVNEKSICSSDYHKITIRDNGIGFEQKHVDKIFMLFKRLETDQTYKGTGLGLAICKKIVDNNNGLITAVGVPDQGSIFSVYLPKNTNLS